MEGTPCLPRRPLQLPLGGCQRAGSFKSTLQTQGQVTASAGTPAPVAGSQKRPLWPRSQFCGSGRRKQGFFNTLHPRGTGPRGSAQLVCRIRSICSAPSHGHIVAKLVPVNFPSRAKQLGENVRGQSRSRVSPGAQSLCAPRAWPPELQDRLWFPGALAPPTSCCWKDPAALTRRRFPLLPFLRKEQSPGVWQGAVS